MQSPPSIQKKSTTSSTVKSNSHYAFDFDEWINENNLQEFRDVFIKHGMNSVSSLSTQSKQFAAFISDPVLFTKPDLISSAVKAIQTLNISINCVLISQKEDDMMQLLEENLDNLTAKKLRSTDLNQQYRESKKDLIKTRHQQIIDITEKINIFFKKILNEIQLKQRSLLNDLNASKLSERIEEEQKHPSIISETEMLIEQNKDQLTEALTAINNIFQQSMDKTRQQRKQEIINIGNKAIAQFNEINISIDCNLDLMEQNIEENKSELSHFAFDLDDDDLDYLTERTKGLTLFIADLTKLQNEETEGSCYNFSTKPTRKDTSDTINEQRSRIASQQGEITGLHEQIYTLRLEYRDLYQRSVSMEQQREEITTLRIQRTNLQTKVYRLVNGNKKLQQSMDNLRHKHAIEINAKNEQLKYNQMNRLYPCFGTRIPPKSPTCTYKYMNDQYIKVEMAFVGRTVISYGNSKRNARNNAFSTFKKRYRMSRCEFSVFLAAQRFNHL